VPKTSVAFGVGLQRQHDSHDDDMTRTTTFSTQQHTWDFLFYGGTREGIFLTSLPSSHILPPRLSEEWELCIWRDLHCHLPPKKYGATIYFWGPRLAICSLLRIHGELKLHIMHAKTAHNFSSGGMADYSSLFPFLGILCICPPLSLLRREGYYGNEEMTKNDEDTKEMWHRRWGLRGY